MNENPYQAPVSIALPPPLHGAVDSEAVAIREAHIVHEASVKGLGLLQIIVGALVTLGGIGAIAVALLTRPQGFQYMIGGGIFYLAIGVFNIFTGSSLRGLRVWARIVSIIFSILGGLFGLMALAMPPHLPGLILLAVNIYILVLMASSKSRMVFSDEYKQIIAVTPWIRYRSKLLWILLGILILFALAVVALALLNVKGPR